ncbi:hypothetical protein EWM64_g3970 [Hericium alpestre]|uniref:Uncharacterized protein n=1 Tax=Hericium alpestre TaxID=135208 RepID=A0A4Y9ZYY5_9AGAM|nr:hypothetical protein EWM64_g3970 [Hericium alpestre]
MNNADPTSFATGHDLTLPDGSVWCRHLLRITSDPSKALFRHLLIRDGLVAEEQFSNYQEVPVPTGVHVRQPITRLGQLFILDFVKHVNQKVTVRSSSRDKPRVSYMYLPLRYEPKCKPRKGFYKGEGLSASDDRLSH